MSWRSRVFSGLSCMTITLLSFTASSQAPPNQAPPNFDTILAAAEGMTYDQLLATIPQRQYRQELAFDPTSAQYFDQVRTQLKLTAQEQEIFRRNGFVSIDHNQRYSFGSAYYAIYTRDLPVLITTDSILHALHRSYDLILQQLETTALTFLIDTVLSKSHDLLAQHAAQNTSPSLGDTYQDVDLYLTVARNLLAGAGAPANDSQERRWRKDEWDGRLLVSSVFGNDHDEIVLSILHQVQSLQMVPAIPLYGSSRPVDFTQFRPRGHYTKSPGLKRYFRTLMWLGRADCGWNILHSNRELRNAVLLSQLVETTGSRPQLRTMTDIIDFMVGKSDNLGVFPLLDILHQTQTSQLTDLDVPDHLATLKKAIAEHPAAQQQIRSQVLDSDPLTLDVAIPPALFQLFGQRFVIDSFILSKVVYDAIIFDDLKVERWMPTGLDVMAALGNNTALSLLEPELTTYHYTANLHAGRVFARQQPPSFWTENLYNLWLDSLRTLDDDLSQNPYFPQVMQTHAWQYKQLQTQLASWAELRHDTILYAKQSYTAYPSCEYPAGYVEPYPDFYARVKYFAEEAARLIATIDTSSVGPKQSEFASVQARQIRFLKQMASHIGQLETLARKELAAEAFSSAEERFVKKTIDSRGGGSGPPRYDGWYPELFYGGGLQAMKWDPTVADVHTDPNSGNVLEVAVGDVNFLVVAIDNENDHIVYVGPSFSYYEFEQPAGKRLTDQEWQKRLISGDLPARPEWTAEFQAPRQQRQLDRPPQTLKKQVEDKLKQLRRRFRSFRSQP